MKTLVTFVHFKRKDEIFEKNLEFFYKIGYFTSKFVDFNIIINGIHGGDFINESQNLKIIRRKNVGHDFGAYKASIDSMSQDYDRFIFINDTCTGPFIPLYIPSNVKWVDLFLSNIDDEVKMVGPTWWNTTSRHSPHIQSWCFGIDKIALDLLLKENGFNSVGKSKSQLIAQHEVGNCVKLRKHGFKIKPFQISSLTDRQNADINWPNQYFGTSVNPFEIMFMKTSRFKNNKVVQNYMSWLMNSKRAKL